MHAHVPSFFLAVLEEPGACAVLSADAAHHARVRRLEGGAQVGLTDGSGRFAMGVIESLDRSAFAVRVVRVETREPPRELHLYVPIADRDRMLWLAEKATEIGITSWRAVHFRRSASVSPRGEGEAFKGKLRARMIAALEQSNGAWLPRIEAEVAIGDVAQPTAGSRILLEGAGEPLATVAAGARGAHVLIGPEGGIEPAEMEQLTRGGWRAARLGINTLRFETAALAAIAILQVGSATTVT
jgi:16S rRNA (uracil1498-N3)-methyltransferase